MTPLYPKDIFLETNTTSRETDLRLLEKKRTEKKTQQKSGGLTDNCPRPHRTLSQHADRSAIMRLANQLRRFGCSRVSLHWSRPARTWAATPIHPCQIPPSIFFRPSDLMRLGRRVNGFSITIPFFSPPIFPFHHLFHPPLVMPAWRVGILMIPTCCYDRISYFLLSMAGTGRGGALDTWFSSFSYLIHSCLLLYFLACLSFLMDD